MSKALETDFTKYVVNPWAFINAPLNAIAKVEREDKPMKKNLKDKMNEEMHQLTCNMHELQELQESDAYAYLSEEDKELVSAQLNAMSTYFNILNTRYRRLKGDYK